MQLMGVYIECVTAIKEHGYTGPFELVNVNETFYKWAVVNMSTRSVMVYFNGRGNAKQRSQQRRELMRSFNH